MLFIATDGEAIDIENNENFIVQFEGRYLRITNTQLQDQGDYTCIASNSAGEASKDFQLVVTGKESKIKEMCSGRQLKEALYILRSWENLFALLQEPLRV